mmetsp:Transcript_10437/g.20889  ORF Transcript_10437/g.20889 Transcript_10437/m.20889 type:complete len:107 (-) Transcript_10437:15-335(-)
MIPVQIITTIIGLMVSIMVTSLIFAVIAAVGFVGAGILQGAAIAALSKYGLGWVVQPCLDVAGIAGIIWGVLNRDIFTETKSVRGGQQAVTRVDSNKDNKPPPPSA